MHNAQSRTVIKIREAMLGLVSKGRAAMHHHDYQIGDPVIFRTIKYTPRPGPRAADIHPAPRGDNYTYHVDKFWVVVEARDDGTVVVQTRRGKQHVIDAGNPRLRHASRWERFRYASRFPKVEAVAGAN